MNVLKGSNDALFFFRQGTTIVFVPSWRDVHHNCVYPQPPFHAGQVDHEVNASFVIITGVKGQFKK